MDNLKKSVDRQVDGCCEDISDMIMEMNAANDAIHCISEILAATNYLEHMGGLPEEFEFVTDEFSQMALYRGIMHISEALDEKIAALGRHNLHTTTAGKGNV